MNPHELIKGLPIKVISRDEVEIGPTKWSRQEIERHHRDYHAIGVIGWRIILALMDEQPPAPEWEPGMVVTGKAVNSFYRLDRFIKREAGFQVWDATSFFDGKSYKELNFYFDVFDVHRRPHEFEAGDWAECTDISGLEHNCPIKFKVSTITSGFLLDDNRNPHPIQTCRQVPAPKERPNPWPDVVLSDVPGALNALARRTKTLLEKLEEVNRVKAG